MTKVILFLIKFGSVTLMSLVILAVLFLLLGSIVHYLYAKKVYQLGNRILKWSHEGKPERIYAMLNNEARVTTSLEEVVLLSQMLQKHVAPGEKVIWHRAFIKKRRGYAFLHGRIFCQDHVGFYITLKFKRRIHDWKISFIRLTEDHSNTARTSF
jgi:hypothetical protein